MESEICFKNKNDQNINTTQAMAELYTTRLGGSHFDTFQIIAVEGNVSLKCVYSGLTPLSAVFQSYHDGVWLLQEARCGLGGFHFYTYVSGFPCAFICLPFMLMALDFSRTQ